MKDVAKGDITRLCSYTRSLLYELNAAGETYGRWNKRIRREMELIQRMKQSYATNKLSKFKNGERMLEILLPCMHSKLRAIMVSTNQNPPQDMGITRQKRLLAQLKQYNENSKCERKNVYHRGDKDSKYKWNLKPPKDEDFFHK